MSSPLVHYVRTRLATIVVAVSLCLASAPPALAQGDRRAEMVRLIGEANAAYKNAEYRRALPRYMRAYRISERPVLLYRIGQVYEKLGNYRRARDFYDLYLVATPDARYASRIRARMRALLELEREKQALVRVDSEPRGATVYVDDLPIAEGETPIEVPLSPGRHRITLRLGDRQPVIDEITISEGQQLEREYAFRAEEAPEEPAEEPPAEEQPPEEQADPDERPERRRAPENYTLTEVDISPPWPVIILGWVGILGGNMLIFGSLLSAAAGPPYGGGTIAAGLLGIAMMGGGSYFLMIKDWTGDVPFTDDPVGPAGRANGESRDGGLGLGIGFRF